MTGGAGTESASASLWRLARVIHLGAGQAEAWREGRSDGWTDGRTAKRGQHVEDLRSPAKDGGLGINTVSPGTVGRAVTGLGLGDQLGIQDGRTCTSVWLHVARGTLPIDAD